MRRGAPLIEQSRVSQCERSYTDRRHARPASEGALKPVHELLRGPLRRRHVARYDDGVRGVDGLESSRRRHHRVTLRLYDWPLSAHGDLIGLEVERMQGNAEVQREYAWHRHDRDAVGIRGLRDG